MYCVKGVFYHLLHIGWRLIYGKVIDQQRRGGVVLIRGHEPLKDGHAPLIYLLVVYCEKLPNIEKTDEKFYTGDDREVYFIKKGLKYK